MANIFISFTSGDRQWAFWIGQELEKLGHVPRIHDWEISAGGDIAKWMDESLDKADHCLLVVSKAYLTKPYSSWERRAAQWAAQLPRPNFALPVFIEACEPPMLLAHLKRCDLHGLSEEQARATLTEFLKPAQLRRPAGPQPFPGGVPSAPSTTASSTAPVPFPGNVYALSNIPLAIPLHFLGRDDALAAIETALKDKQGRVAITALYGLRGVGKTVLAAAYADAHHGEYRATWWIRAQTDTTMRADLVGLGIRLGWVAPDDKEDPAVAAVMERLRHEGEGILLIYDNAIDADSLRPYLPRGGAAKVLVTSNAYAWRGVAAPVEIRVWPKEIGVDYLIARTGRERERAAAESLSEALGGLPLAHEQAAGYCENLGIALAEYQRRFTAATVAFLDHSDYAPAEYHPEHAAEHKDRLTVAGTFRLAIEEAAKRHPAAESLIIRAALLAPESIPLFLFAEAREKFDEPLATAFAGDGIDKVVAALRTLVYRESIMYERDPAIRTETIRLHRLVREVAAARLAGEARDDARRALIAALAAVYPDNAHNHPASWPRCASLTPHVLALCGTEAGDAAARKESAELLNKAGSYFHGRAAYAAARPLFERALAILEKVLGPEHPDLVQSLNNLGLLLLDQGEFAGARPVLERALAIREKVLGPEHPDLVLSLNNLGLVLRHQGDFAGARLLFERALEISPASVLSLNNLGLVLRDQGDFAGARLFFERTLEINEKVLGPEHPDTAACLNNLAGLLRDQGDLAGARPLFERALDIREKVLGTEHRLTAISLHGLAELLTKQGDLAGARPLLKRALEISEKVLGPEHPETAICLNNLANVLQAQGDFAGARPLYERSLAINEKVLGPEHPNTVTVRKNLASLRLRTG
jgi:tetratricopeptide (TPR) repeat protein